MPITDCSVISRVILLGFTQCGFSISRILCVIVGMAQQSPAGVEGKAGVASETGAHGEYPLRARVISSMPRGRVKRYRSAMLRSTSGGGSLHVPGTRQQTRA